MKHHVSSGYVFEEEYGYSRAVKAGQTVYVSGTTARLNDLDEDAYGQSIGILETISAALSEVGAELNDVVRTVVYVTSMDNAALVAKAHAEAFGVARPASTLVEVSKLTPSKALVEFEVTAVLES